MIIMLILVCVLVGFLLWLVPQFIPMDPVVFTIVRAVVILLLLLYVLTALGLVNTSFLRLR